MGFIEMTILGYKILLCVLLGLVALLSVAVPLGIALSEDSGVPLLFYLITPLIVSGCVKIICLL